MILVVGATGLVGMEVCLLLAQRNKRVRALVRTTSDPVKVAALQAAGVELCLGDLKQPETLATACHGIEAIISTASSTFSRAEGDSIETVDEQGQLHLVAAAKNAGVRRFVFVSFRKPQGISVPLAEAKSRVEQSLAEMDFTVLLASFFTEVWLSPAVGFDAGAGKVRIYGPGTSPISWVSFRDVALMCVRVLDYPAASRRSIEIGGPEALSPLEVVQRFEAVSGRKFQLEHVPTEALFAQFAAAEDSLQKSFAALMLGYAHGDAMEMEGVAREFELELTSLDRYARSVLQATEPA